MCILHASIYHAIYYQHLYYEVEGIRGELGELIKFAEEDENIKI